MKSKSYYALFVLLFSILTLSLVSANTFVIGKIYDTSFDNSVSGASVSVACQGNTKDTISLSDGTYGVGFELAECPDDSTVDITAIKDNLKGTNGGPIDNSNETDFFTVKNIIMIIQPSPPPGDAGGGGGGGRGRSYYLCGNGVCDSGETASLCPKDCQVANETAAIENETSEENLANTSPEEENTGLGSRITGAFIGTLGKTGSIAAGIFILAIIALWIVTFLIRRNREVKKPVKKEEKKEE